MSILVLGHPWRYADFLKLKWIYSVIPYRMLFEINETFSTLLEMQSEKH